MCIRDRVEDVEKRADRLAAVTAEDVQAVARKYIQPNRSVTGFLIPDPAKVARAGAEAEPRSPGKAGDVTIH
jgi:zinc protease